MGSRLETGENRLVWSVLTRASTLKLRSWFPSSSELMRAFPFQKIRRGSPVLGMLLNWKVRLPTNQSSVPLTAETSMMSAVWRLTPVPTTRSIWPVFWAVPTLGCGL